MANPVNEATGRPGMYRPVLVLTCFMALLVTLILTTLLDDRILDWEELRVLPTEPTSFAAISERHPTYEFLQRVNFWINCNVLGSDIESLRFLTFAAAFTTLALAVSLCTRLTGNSNLAIVVLFALGTGAFFVEFARWGISYYATGILYSICISYLLLRIHEGTATTSVRWLLALCSFAGVYVSQREAIFVWATGPLTVLVAHLICRPGNRPPLRQKFGALLYTIPFFAGFAITGWNVTVANLPWLFDKGASLLHDPKTYRSNLYFQYVKQYPKTVKGFFDFYCDRTLELLSQFFLPIGPGNWYIQFALGAMFLVGVLVSLAGLRRRQIGPRQFIGLFFFSGLLVCVVLNLLHINPYGNARYCTFLFFPAVALVAFGLGDVVDLAVRPFSTRRRAAERIAYALVSIVLCAAAVDLFKGETTLRIQRGRDARAVIAGMQGESDLIIVCGRYKRTMRMYAPENEKRAIGISDDIEEIRQRLADPACNTVTVVSRFDTTREENEKVEALIQSSYLEDRHAGLYLHSSIDYVYLFYKYDINVRSFTRRASAMD